MRVGYIYDSWNRINRNYYIFSQKTFFFGLREYSIS